MTINNDIKTKKKRNKRNKNTEINKNNNTCNIKDVGIVQDLKKKEEGSIPLLLQAVAIRIDYVIELLTFYIEFQ